MSDVQGGKLRHVPVGHGSRATMAVRGSGTKDTVRRAFDTLGRWRDGFDGHYLYFLRGVGTSELVKVGATCDLPSRIVAHQGGSPWPLEYALVLPGKLAHERYVHRRFVAHRMRGEWFNAAPVMAFAQDAAERLAVVQADSGRDALIAVLTEMDPEIEHLQRLWTNGVTVPAIAELTRLPEAEIINRVRQLREMGFPLAYRYGPRAGR